MTTPTRNDQPRGNLRTPGLVQWVRRLLWAAGIGAAVALIFAYLWPATRRFESVELQTVSFIAFAVRTLVFHFGVGFAVLGLCALAMRARRLAIVAAATGVVMLGPLALTYTSRAGGAGTDPSAVLTVYSANVLRGRADVALIAEQVRAQDADVVLIQEATPPFARLLREELDHEYPFIEEASRTGAYGQMTLSRHPFAATGEHYPQGELATMFPARSIINPADPQLRCVIEFAGWDGTEVVIQNIHLTSPGGVEAVAQQLEQARWLAAWGRQETRPCVMLGDFNCTPTSAHAGMIRAAGWRDAHARAGSGRGVTWPARSWLRHLPGVRIDHAYSLNGPRAVEMRVLEALGSDHRPIVARFVIEPAHEKGRADEARP